jgi:hypothetical protein
LQFSWQGKEKPAVRGTPTAIAIAKVHAAK